MARECMVGGMQCRGVCMAGAIHGKGVHGGGMHGRGVCMAGAMRGKGVHGGGHAWQGNVHGKGMHGGGGHAWQGGMHGRGVCVARGYAWQGACMKGDTHGMRDGHCSRWYASSWNAFLLSYYLYMKQQVIDGQ